MNEDLAALEPFEPTAPDEATELRALERALSLAKGFTLLLVSCNQLEDRRRLIAALRKRLPQLAMEEIEFPSPIDHLLDELSIQLENKVPSVVFVSGLENSFSHDIEARDVPLIANLNASRNSFPATVPCPLVMWVPHYVLLAIMRGAPDFFSIRSGTYFFAATPQNTQALSQFLIAGDEGTAHSLPASEKRERIAAIRSLLSDYQSLPVELRDYEAEFRLLIRLGNMLEGMGQTKEAITVFEECLNLSRAVGNRFREGAALSGLGIAYSFLGETQRAIEFYEEALMISREIGDRVGESAAIGNLGVAYSDLGEIQTAIELYEQALEIDREMGDQSGEGNDLMNLGNAYCFLREMQRAVEFYEQALVVFRKIGDRHSQSGVLGNLGNAYDFYGEKHRAIEFYDQELTIAREIGNKRGEAISLWNMSLTLDKLGERTQAINLAQEALYIFEQIEDPFAVTVRQALQKWSSEVEETQDAEDTP